MHLICPHCQAQYDIERDIGDAVLVCHQCRQEFSPPAVSPEHGDIAPVDTAQAPVRHTTHIWPWLLMILIVLTTAGFWIQKDAWLDNRWLRSSLTNIGFDMALRAKDWRIDPASIQAQWIVRSDGSRSLLIRGVIQNLLNSEMPLPKINMILFSKTEPDQQIGNIGLEIILQSTDPQLAVRDTRPVPALGQRRFTVMAESLPDNTGDFSLMPAFD